MTAQQDPNDMIARRKARREEQRQQALRQRRKLRLQLAAVAIVALGAAGLVFAFSRGVPAPAPTEPAVQTVPATTAAPVESSEESSEETAPRETEKPEYTVIHIAAAGDLNVTDEMLELAKTPTGYDFTPNFLDVAPVLSEADLTVLNLEGTLCGAPYGGESSSAPQELAQALKDIGVDAVQTANSASIRGGVLGLQATIENLSKAGIVPIGTFYDSRAFRDCGGFTMFEVQGIRIALVGFTKGMDNLGLPQGSESCVNVLYEDYTTDYTKVDYKRIEKVLSRVEEEQPDLTIAMVHWGSEYKEELSSSQKKIKNTLLEGGVDVILGTHPHLVQAVEFDRQTGQLVAYSLGDFHGSADQPGTNYSLVLDLEVTRDNLTGETRVTDYGYTPIYTVRPESSGSGGLRTVQLEHAMQRYESNYLGRVDESTYHSMEYAKERLRDRLSKEMK